MSLSGALNVGQTALAVAQAQIQTTGNNIANANTAGYTREVAGQAPLPAQQLETGLFIGTGVTLTGISQQIDQALESRLRNAGSDASASQTTQDWLGQIESSLNALGGNDIGSQLTSFFNSWSNLANKPQDAGLRQTVLQSGDSLAQTFQGVRGQLVTIQGNIAQQYKSATQQANSLAQQIADLNAQIVVAEGGSGGQAAGLRDERGQALAQLSQLVNVTTQEQPNGAVNVYIGSDPLVSGTENRGVSFTQSTAIGSGASALPTYTATFKDGSTLVATGGQLGALASVQQQIGGAVQKVDTLANNLVFEVNKIHASGQGLDGFSSITSSSTVLDPNAALNDPRSGLKFTPGSGSFVVHVVQKSTGLETSTLVPVDLSNGGSPTTLNSLKAALSAISGVNASITGGKLTISAANADTQISFSQDSSGTLAALGLNNFFIGSGALDIGVNQALKDQPNLLAAAKNGQPADNQTALAIAALNTQALGGLKNQSLSDAYQSLVNGVSTANAAAKTNAEAAKSITDTLQAQRDALSGVSLDEEAVNLIRQQRAYQGAARLISTVDDLMKTLMAIT